MSLQNPYCGPVAAQALGNLYPAANSARLFYGGNQAAVATALTAGVPTTYTGGLVLANPAASTVNLVLEAVTVALVLAQTNAAAISLGLGYSATPLAGTLTAVPSIAANLTSVAQGLLYSSASITLPVAPTLAQIIGDVDTAAVTTEINSATLSANLQGGVIIPPGGFACILSTATGTASSLLASFAWAEVPLA